MNAMSLSLCLSVQELSGQQQTSSAESEFDFPQDDSAFSSSEFWEEGGDFKADHMRSSNDAGTSNGKQSLFDGYKDPSRQFNGHTRSYHHDARYEPLQSTVDMLLLLFGG